MNGKNIFYIIIISILIIFNAFAETEKVPPVAVNSKSTTISIDAKSISDNKMNVCDFKVMKEGLNLKNDTDISVSFCSVNKKDENCLYLKKIKDCDLVKKERDDLEIDFCKRVDIFKKCILNAQKENLKNQ
jgi:hypothetical protein